MSCFLCFTVLEFHEIAGFNPTLSENDTERTNFCWEDDSEQRAVPICDECYWAPDRSDEIPELEHSELDENTEEEDEPIPIYSFCCLCHNVIQEISDVGLTDEELDHEMFTHTCNDCLQNPSTPPPTSPESESPSDGQASPSWAAWSQPLSQP
jgi:hypothetical protein